VPLGFGSAPLRRRARAVVVAVALVALGSAGSAQAAAPLQLGFLDGAFTGSSAAAWLQRSAAAGADVVRVDIGWNAPNTPTKPAGFDARDPADPNYAFTNADQAMRLAAVDGLKVILTFTYAPQWAEGPGIPASVAPGSWKPQPSALEDYGYALATRYSGHFPDPMHPGQFLPRAYAFQPWNEPNLDLYLSPQWQGNQPEAPVIYRAMLDAFYAGAKAADPHAVVVTAGTAPFGDLNVGGSRLMPALFWRTLLCERQVGSSLVSTHCKDPAHFDVLAHHPYSVGAPDTAAFNPDDVSIPDIGKLRTILRAAERFGTALPRIHHPIWVTEVSYISKPPNPQGVPMNTWAHWVEQTLYILQSEGVPLIVWNQVGDQPPVPSHDEVSESGVYFVNGSPKPEGVTAFDFPFVGHRLNSSAVSVWGRAPAAGAVVVQRRQGGAWIAERRITVAAHATFQATLSMRGSGVMRAVLGTQTSLVWTVSK
jgi:hypothetical protein